MTISCPNCGLAFETQATTNTRCRRCKAVVRIGSRPARPRRTDQQELHQQPPAEFTGGGAVVVAAFLFLALSVGVSIIRYYRQCRALSAEQQYPDDHSTTGEDA